MTNRLSNGVCNRCWQAHPDRPFTRAATLAGELGEIPDWFDGFVARVASVHCPARAALLISALGRLLTDGQSTHPQALLERSRQPGRSMGSLARALEMHFHGLGLAMPTDQDQRLAAGRRDRRIQAVPEQFRPAVARYAESMLTSRARATRAGTRPRTDSTIEGSLGVLRDLARHLAGLGRTDWSQVTTTDIEGYLAGQNPNNRRTLSASRLFFRWARRNRVILIDPTSRIPPQTRPGLRGAAVTLTRQRRLFARWTTAPDTHPHESFIGLLALLHGATNTEVRGLHVTDIDQTARTIQLGTRPHPTPLDPPTWAALQRCLKHRQGTRTSNPHLLVTRTTKMDLRPISTAYVCHVLDPAGIAPRQLRTTRIADLVNTLDPKLVAAAYGMKPETVLPYLADHVDPGRLPDELANPPTSGAT